MLEAVAQHRRPWPDPETPDLAVPAGMRRERFRAMGTTVSVLLPESHAVMGATAVRTLFEDWEQTLSRFRPDSELSALNARAGEPVVARPLLFAVVAAALEAARATDGVFDPTMLRQLVCLGYDRPFEVLPTRLPGSLAVVGSGGGWRSIELDAACYTITLPRGVSLDLGGIAKGMAVDAALDRLQAMAIDAALVNAGGDLGVRGLPLNGQPWPITVPLRHGEWPIALHRGAVATSGIGRRRWQQDGRERHHILDPRSGQPVKSGLWSVSVGAESCVQAEVAAKAACVLGPSAGAAFLEAQGLAGLLVKEGGAWHATARWPARPADGGRVR